LKTCATTTSETKVAKLRAEPQTIGTEDLKRIYYAMKSVTLHDKLSILFEGRHMRRIHSHFQL